MKRYIARHILMARLAALALIALCFLQAPVRAQETTCNVIFPSVGVAPDQRISFTLFNPNGAPVRAQAQIHYGGGFTGGVYVASGDVNSGAFHSFNINHSDIPMPCYENTCRKQIIPSVKLTFSDSEAIKPVVASMEIIDIRDGTSNTILVGEALPSAPNSGGGKDILIGGSGSDYLMGLVPSQKALVTVYHPSRLVLVEDGSYEKSGPIGGHVKVFDASGNLIAQSPEMVIPPGESRSFEYNPYITVDYVDPGANRAQVRIKPDFTYRSEQPPALPSDDMLMTSLVSFEVVDNSTGKTVTLSGQQCLVFYLGGTR